MLEKSKLNPPSYEAIELPVSLRVFGSLEKIFQMWTLPELAQKWLCDKIEGKWAMGETVTWDFGDFRQEIRITKYVENSKIFFCWNAYGTQSETEVEIHFTSMAEEVGIKIIERGWPMKLENVKIALDHACGWENMLCRLKAWAQARVNLNKKPKPITPMVGCDVFVLNSEKKLLLIQRADNGLWALPGGCHDLNETPRQCAERECLEETGYSVKVIELLGSFSSNCYKYVNYPWKDNQFCHLLFRAELVAGSAALSSETLSIRWFSQEELPPLSDGHLPRIQYGFAHLNQPKSNAYFE